MGSFAFVTNVSSRSISVIDTAANAVVATPSVDAGPIRIALTPDGKNAYVTMRGNNEGKVAVLDTTTHVVTATFR
jgi:YVTN family beta-propeller protein